MKIFYNKSRYGIVMMVVLAMLLQIIVPVAESVYAQGDTVTLVDGNFAIEAHKTEKGKATVSWEYVYRPGEKTEYELNLGSIFEQYKEESGVLIADEGEIGEYTISQDGAITINIDENIEEIVRELREEIEIPKEPEVPEEDPITDDNKDDDTDIEGEEETDASEVTDETEDDDEGITDDSTDIIETPETEEPATEEPVETGRIGKPLVSLASIEDIEELYLDDESYTFEGSFEVEGIVVEAEQPKRMTFAAGRDLGDIFTITSVEVKINNKIVDPNDNISVGENDKIEVKYDWKIEDGALNSGDWVTVKIPDAFKLESDMKGALNFGGLHFGNFYISKDNNELKIIFGDGASGFEEFNDMRNRGGEVKAELVFNTTYFNQNTTQKIKFTEDADKTYTITLKPKDGKEIDKRGKADRDKNATEIYWEIDVNTSLDIITNAIVKDELPSGSKVITEIKVWKLQVGYDGSLEEVEELTVDSEGDTIANFPIKLGDIDSAYRIKYTTKITDPGETSFKNEASLNGGTPIEKEVTTEIGQLIENKIGTRDRYLNAKTIDWSFDINTREANIVNAVVTDELVPGLRLVPGTIKIYKLDIDNNKIVGNPIEDFDIKYLDNNKKFEIEFININGQPYRVKYQTEIDYTEIDTTDNTPFNKEYSFVNTAKITVDNAETDTTSEPVEVKRDTLIEKNGEKSTDPEKKEITWTIDINKGNADLKNVIITDTLTNHSGLNLEYVTFTIKNNKTGDITTQTLTAENGVFTINLGSIDSHHTITYTTTIVDLETVSVSNTAKVTATENGKDVEGTIGTGNINPGIPSEPTINKSSTDIDYNKKIISWKTDINIYKGKVTELTVTDEFPNKDMIFKPDTLKVRHYKVGGFNKPLSEGTHYTVSEKDGSYQNGFEIVFNFENITIDEFKDSRIEIIYDTDFDPNNTGKKGGPLDTEDKTSKIYINNVKYEGKLDYLGEINKTITQSTKADKTIDDIPYNNGTKTGKLSEKDRSIDWKLYLNYLGKKLARFEVVDELSDGQVIKDLDSIVVKPYTISKDGKLNGVVVGSSAEAEKFEIVGLEGDPENGYTKFKIVFEEGVTKPYLVEYTTDIVGISEETYTNTAKVEGYPPYTKTEKYEDHDNFLEKKPTGIGPSVWVDDVINWELTINKSLSHISGATITDKIGEGLILLEDSIKIYNSDNVKVYDSKNTDDTNPLVKYSWTGSKDGKGESILEIKFSSDIICEAYIIKYSTVVAVESGSVKNGAIFKGNSGITEGIETVTTTETTKDVEVKQAASGSGYGEYTGRISLSKKDKDTGEYIDGAKFKLYYDLNGTRVQIGDEFTVSGGIYVIEDLSYRTYYLKEIEAPKGYVLPEDELIIELNKSNWDYVLPPILNTEIKGKIQFTKVNDDDNLISGVTFTLYDEGGNNPVLDKDGEDIVAISNSDGIVLFENIPYGKYTIKETSAPDEYVKSDDVLYVIIGDDDNGETVIPTKDKAGTEKVEEFINARKKGSIKLKKVDENGGALEGATFKLYYKTDIELTNEIKSATSDSNGIVEFKEVPYDDYIIVETNPPTGGYKPSSEDIKVLKEDFISATDGKIDLTLDEKNYVVNEKIKGNIVIIKKGEGENRLQGAKFGLFKNKTDIEPIAGLEGVTGETGYLIFEKVPYGTYFIKEMEAPDGYLISDEDLPKQVTVNESNDDVTQEFIFHNTKIRGNIQLLKQDAYGNSLEGAKFALYDENGKNPVLDKDGKNIVAISGDKGIVLFENIPYGKYQVKEIKSPEGYKLEVEKAYHISIKEDGVTVEKDINDNALIVTNIELGRIKIIKVDNANENRRLSGAIFEVRDIEGAVIDTVTTDRDGIAMVEELEYGTYTIGETKAPSGYRLNRQEYSVTVNGEDDGENIEVSLTVKNTRIPVNPGPGPDPTDPEPPVRPPVKPPTKPPVDPEKPTEPTEPVDPTEPVEITEVPEPEEPEIPIVITPPKGGTVEFDEDGNWKYTPNPEFTGKDSFVLKHPDGTEELIEIDVDAPLGGTDADQKAPTLPKTGQVGSILIYLVGLLFIVVGIVLRRRTV
ncbi:SpaA isopeptide-forming pilin-related protein [Tissierella sp. MB52-C2]|uniref:SpaA isopeptide-forming pilin-related protein n=1 Tax=Tissierella sp. MB52-C2 TaxID=3070999 RepID=UPI00280BF0F1|nr:SpaA isopeptide-forming pilin-related protein [Tissierella sp. MB52-C2]WMM24473.1 SpaA isopeptide-forming pilin-related protein [Tissierella sp. MB52-C2]